MKILHVNSLKQLFWRTVATTSLLNLLFIPIIYAPALFHVKNFHAYSTHYLVAQSILLAASLLWGICIRKANIELLQNTRAPQKKYAIGTLVLWALLLVRMLIPDLSIWFWAMMGTLIKLTNIVFIQLALQQIYAVFSSQSILLALSAVFWYKPRKSALCS